MINAQVGSPGTLTPTNYNWAMRDVLYLCRITVPMDCIRQEGPIACMLATLRSLNNATSNSSMVAATGGAGATLPPQSSPSGDAAAAPQAGTGAGSGSGSGGGVSDSERAGIIAGTVVGGVVVLVGALLAVWWHRARRQRSADVEVGKAAEVGIQIDGNATPPATASGTGGDDESGSTPLHGASEADSKQLAMLPRRPDASTTVVITSQTPFTDGLNTRAGLLLPEDESSPRAAGVAAKRASGEPHELSAPSSSCDSHLKSRDRTGDLDVDVVHLLPGTLLGKGAFAAVHAGTYRGEQVAVKLLLQGFGEQEACSEKVRSTLVAELEILARCRHQNVIRLLAACLGPPRPFMVLERMEISLDKLLYGRGEDALLPFKLVLHIATEIARGLEYLHPTILHRDLKPANVLIRDPWGPKPVVKLSDFGLSRLRATVLRTATPDAGTPAYLAPECFDVGNDSITHKADIWSFGTLLWECLAGERPWTGSTALEVAITVTMRRLRLPLPPRFTPGGRFDSRWPPRIVRMLTECFETDPQRRPAAAELVKRLVLVAEGAR
ncbi:hypothetical protein HYH03_016561 [Edaphochlamys debaryana]|uniref:Protein kinase domain-containing protein n=1 Tax=Edaphochlamys debaryana TaxID=47281 RepID=A0A835XH83_9CHLO|nr:hypothetical protein HYH03_016561 [Edaphochlamys debaryana]|eukprot:KAG2484607.1 hypothetical protein HYH03_016561 [Edaphochlamys debaryana]